MSVGQIVSEQPGLIPQVSAFLTNQRLWVATTFVDHIIDYLYVHLMRYLFVTKTLLAESAMEKVMAQAGLTVKHYRDDNGRFADSGSIDAVNGKDYKITFCVDGTIVSKPAVVGVVVLNGSSSLCHEFLHC